MGNGIWTSGRSPSPRCSALSSTGQPGRARQLGREGLFRSLSHGRAFTKDEIWENYTHFIKQVAPVAKRRNHIGIHPDDPPVPVLAGVPSSGTSRATSAWRSPTARTLASASVAGRGWKVKKETDGQGSEERSLFRRAEDLEDPLPASARRCRFRRDVHGRQLLRHVEKVMKACAASTSTASSSSSGVTRRWWVGTMHRPRASRMKALLNRANAEARA
jgi:hypothetical protein